MSVRIVISECCPAESPRRILTPQPARETEANCPVCGHAGRPVTLETLKQQVKPEHLEKVETGVFHFCRTATCEMVYFNERAVALTKADVRERIGLKETQDPVPICYCFGFTEKMVADELRATGECAIPQRIAAEIRAGHCACEIRNPQGSCCLRNVNAVVRRQMKALTMDGLLPHAHLETLATGQVERAVLSAPRSPAALRSGERSAEAAR
jgi:Zinc binding domain